MKAMSYIYANLIQNGHRTIDTVPEKLREEVKEILIERGFPRLAGVE
jgi:hypothetical protein